MDKLESSFQIIKREEKSLDKKTININ